MTERDVAQDSGTGQGGGKAVGVLVVHGMGTQDETYANKMMAELKERLGENEQHVAWQPVFWADILSERQEQYLRDAERISKAKGQNLDWIWARRFVVDALSDAASYRWAGSDSLDEPETTYGKIHQRVSDALVALKEEVRGDAGLVVLAHSLGGQIVSNYIWDVQEEKATPGIAGNRYEGAGSLRLLVTFGCNIPLFTFALEEVVPIELPVGAEWHNYYDRDDLLGYPLQPIPAYKDVCKDVEINVGGFLSSWNMFSHKKYWTDNDFTRPVAMSISEVVAAEVEPDESPEQP